MQCDDDALHLGVLSNVLCLCESSSVNMVLCRSFVLYWKEQALKATVCVIVSTPHRPWGEDLLFFVLVLQGAGSWCLLCCVELCQKQALALQERMEVVGHCTALLWGQG